MRSRRVGLLILAASFVTVGVWAQFAPASFFESFPVGRAWVAPDGPYNEHLVRDVGGLNLALALVVTVAAIRLRPELTRLAAAGALVYEVPHLAYHALHLAPFGVVDAVAVVVSLGLAVVVPLWLVIAPAPRDLSGSTRVREGTASGGH